MSVIVKYGGGGGGGVDTPGTVHDTTGAVAHWPFNNTLVEEITGGAGYNFEHGYPNYALVGPRATSLYGISTVERETGVTNVNAALKLNAAVTVACWFCVQDDAIASPNVQIWSCMVAGATSAQNAFWGIRIDQANSKITGFWHSGARVSQSVNQTGTYTKGVWTHVAFTRSADSSTAKLYINGQLDNTATGLSAHTDGSSVNQLVCGHDQATNKTMISVASPIIFDSEKNGADVLALYQSTLV